LDKFHKIYFNLNIKLKFFKREISTFDVFHLFSLFRQYWLYNMNNLTIFCLPFAGGSKYSLAFLKKVLPRQISCHFLEYRGRGTRIKEDFAENIDDVVDDIYKTVSSLLERPYAIYGHSMGAKVAYLLTLRIREGGKRLPIHLFISGTDAPSVAARKSPKHLLPKDEFVTAVKELGGLPDEILGHEEMLEYFEPILRADFKISESYQYKETQPLKIPITVMVGDKEDMREEDILKWQSETLMPIKLYKFPGNHFFIFENEKQIGEIIEAALIK
jgi:surfactin synthase thioesterase subunit